MPRGFIVMSFAIHDRFKLYFIAIKNAAKLFFELHIGILIFELGLPNDS
jgi:hypothetical protein